MTWYDDLLEFIAKISNSIAESLAELFSDLFGKEQKRLQNYDYNVYNSKLGTEIYYQLGTKLREYSINQLYRSSNGDVFFMTPAGHGQSTAVASRVDDDGEVVIDGYLGGRKNGWTSDNVYGFTWVSYRDKLPLPQYRTPVTKPWDEFGTAYYSIVNAPSPLKKILNNEQIQGTALLGSDSLRRVYQPLTDRGFPETREKTQLYKISLATYGYLRQQDSFPPYVGYAGASNLYCSNSSKGDIRIVYWNADRQTPTVAYYNPAGLIHNERSVSSNTQTITENGDFQSVDYRIFNNLQIGDFTYRVDDNYKLFINDTLLPPLYSGGMFKLYSNFSIGLPVENPTPNQVSQRSLDRDEDLTSMQNYRERIDTQINTAVINDTGRRRMPRYVSAVAKLPLERTDDYV